MRAVRTATTSEVQQLLAEGAQLVDVLPAETFVQEHLPGAISIPLAEINSAAERLEPSRPVVVYCYDYQCDLSPRAACRLRQLGFERVYDYVASKAAWLAEGLPGDGLLLDRQRAGGVARRDVPRIAVDCSLADAGARFDGWELAAVVSDDGIVVGAVRAEAVSGSADVIVGEVMQTAPATVRPSISQRELAESMDRDGQDHVLVTTLDGRLVGLVRRADLR